MAKPDDITLVRPEPWTAVPSVDALGGKNCLVKIYPATGAGGLVELPAKDFVLGRDASCDLDLMDPDVSRRHALIRPTHEGFRLLDLDSTNGTFVNDEAVSDRMLVAGDYIRIGGHVMKFLSSDHIESQYHEAIYTLMVTDGLTGAGNRRHLLEVLEKELARSRRHQRPLSLAMIDLDDFKSVNDTYGHLAGDNVLRQFVQRVVPMVREDEVFARFGGEEFAVILGEANAEDAVNFAERVRKYVAQEPFTLDGKRINVTVSIGIAHTPGGEAISVDQLIQRADQMLYQAKGEGRNRVRV